LSIFIYITLANIKITSALVIFDLGLIVLLVYPFKYPASIAPSTDNFSQLDTLFKSLKLFNLSKLLSLLLYILVNIVIASSLVILSLGANMSFDFPFIYPAFTPIDMSL